MLSYTNPSPLISDILSMFFFFYFYKSDDTVAQANAFICIETLCIISTLKSFQCLHIKYLVHFKTFELVYDD